MGRYPFFHPNRDVWAKGDMLTCVAFRRLDRVLLNGHYVAPSLRPDDFAAIRRAVLAALERVRDKKVGDQAAGERLSQ